GDLLGEVAIGHGGGHLRNIAHLGGEVTGHAVDVIGEVLPHTGHATNLRLAAELALGTDLTGDARHFGGEGVELIDHGVDRVLQFLHFALAIYGDLLGQVAVGDGGGHLRDVAYLGRQVARHAVDTVGQVLPRA